MYGVLPAEITGHTAADAWRGQLNPAFGSVCGPLKDDPKSLNINTTFLSYCNYSELSLGINVIF